MSLRLHKLSVVDKCGYDKNNNIMIMINHLFSTAAFLRIKLWEGFSFHDKVSDFCVVLENIMEFIGGKNSFLSNKAVITLEWSEKPE